MPAINVSMLDKEYAAGAVNNHGTGAERRSARESPIKMHAPPDDRLEHAAKAVLAHKDEISLFRGGGALSKALLTAVKLAFLSLEYF
jgi:hypothetical protein